MNKKESVLISRKYSIDKLYKKHFSSTLRRVEFILCLFLYFLVTYFQLSKYASDNIKGVIAQFQTFIIIYLAFRFTVVGLSTMVAINIIEILNIFRVYYISNLGTLTIATTVKTVTIICAVIVCLLQLKQERQKNELRRLVNTDDTTNIYNRRFFNATLHNLLAEAEQKNGSLGLIIFDIDDFKKFNENYGQDIGDKVLKATSQLLRDHLIENNNLFRYGGDEFAILVPGVDNETLIKNAQYLKEKYDSLKNKYYDGIIGANLTISIGLSLFPTLAKSQEELISQADTALYHAKNIGKDKINIYHDIIDQLRRSTNSDYQQLILIFKALLNSISAKDKYTLGHSERVSIYAEIIGEELQLNSREVSVLIYAGLFHDIGKIEVPSSILNKISPLTDEEFQILRLHPVYSASILEPLGGMNQLIEIVRHHHERYDGKGYPDKLSGSEICLGARILCVADSFDAMLSERPYKRRLSLEEAFDELDRCSGTQFDARIVAAFKKGFNKQKLDIQEKPHNPEFQIS